MDDRHLCEPLSKDPGNDLDEVAVNHVANRLYRLELPPSVQNKFPDNQLIPHHPWSEKFREQARVAMRGANEYTQLVDRRREEFRRKQGDVSPSSDQTVKGDPSDDLDEAIVRRVADQMRRENPRFESPETLRDPYLPMARVAIRLLDKINTERETG